MAQRLFSLLTVFLMGLVLSACSLTGDGDNEPVDRAGEAPEIISLGSDEILSRVGRLPAQTLGQNECGMFLWLRRDDVPLLFFQLSDGRAYMAVDGSVRNLNRTGAEDVVALQYFKRQQFTAPGLKVSLSINPEDTPSLQQGLRINSGTVSLEVDGGWAASLPVAGLIGCQ